MKSTLFFIAIGLYLLSCSPVKSQGNFTRLDDVYGLNPELYSGRVYTDFYNTKVNGHQFLKSPSFSTGSVVINKQDYKNQQLNYDIFKQKLLLSFTNYSQAHRIIEIPLSKVYSFSLSNKQFRILKMHDSTLKIFQVIGDSTFNILIFWRKNINTTTSTSVYDYKFTDAMREIWVIRNREYKQINSNKSLLKLFTKEQSQKIKTWLKAQNIRVKKASDQQLEELSKFLYTL